MSDYQVQYRGLLMGLGTDYHIQDITGLESDEVRIGDIPIPRGGGDIPGLHYPSGRSVEMTIVVGGVKGSQEQRDRAQALINAFQHSEQSDFKLYWDEPGFEERRFVYGRPAGRTAVRNPMSPFLNTHMVRVKLSDPRTYRETSTTANIEDYNPGGGGLDFDITEYSKDYSAAAGSEGVMNNAGNAKAWPIIQFFGPTTGTITQVTLTNTTSGQAPTVFNSTLLTGQILTADMDAIVTARRANDFHVIRLGGTNKFSEWAQPRDPFYLVPGDNVLRFEITGGTSIDGTCALSFRDTWL